MIVIDSNLKIGSDNSTQQMKVKGGNCYICGKVMGYVDQYKTLYSKDVLKALKEHIDSGYKLSDFIRWSIGSFFVILKEGNKINICVSPKGPGFLYFRKDDKLHISTDELKVARNCVQDGINEMELVHMLRVVPNYSPPRSPFKTIFSNVNRAPGGTKIEITKELKLQISFYIAEKLSFLSKSRADNYLLFKRMFEDTCDVVCRERNNEELYSMFSAGIDSSVITMASLKKGHSAIPWHWRKSETLDKAVEIFCRKMAVSPKYVLIKRDFENLNEKDFDIAKLYFSNTLGVKGFKFIYLPMSECKASYLSGLSFGCVIQTNAMMRTGFGVSSVRHSLQTVLQNVPFRFLFTECYYNLLKKGYSSGYLKLAGLLSCDRKWKSPVNIYDYLLCLTITNKLPLWPREILPHGLRELEFDYLRYIDNTNMREVLGDYYDVVKDNDYGSLNFDDIRRLSRLVRYANQVQRGSMNDACYASTGNIEILTPAAEGPMITYFMNHPLTLRDIFFSKEYLLRYFKEEYGSTYSHYLDDLLNESKRKSILDWMKAIRRRLYKTESSDCRNTFMDNPSFKKYLQSILNVNNSNLIPMIKNTMVRDYVISLYNSYKENGPYNYLLTNQLLNVEHFLANAFN